MKQNKKDDIQWCFHLKAYLQINYSFIRNNYVHLITNFITIYFLLTMYYIHKDKTPTLKTNMVIISRFK